MSRVMRAASLLSNEIHPSSFLCFDRRSNWIYSGLETLLLGGACATLAYTIGRYVNNLVGEDVDVP